MGRSCFRMLFETLTRIACRNLPSTSSPSFSLALDLFAVLSEAWCSRQQLLYLGRNMSVRVACQPVSITLAVALRSHGANARSDREIAFTLFGVVTNSGEKGKAGQPEVNSVS